MAPSTWRRADTLSGSPRGSEELGGGPSGGPSPRVLFIPNADFVRTSERTPALLHLMRKRYSVAALPAPLDRLIYDPARPIWPRAFLYLLDKALLVLRWV